MSEIRVVHEGAVYLLFSLFVFRMPRISIEYDEFAPPRMNITYAEFAPPRMNPTLRVMNSIDRNNMIRQSFFEITPPYISGRNHSSSY